jgi:hypothetical protein
MRRLLFILFLAGSCLDTRAQAATTIDDVLAGLSGPSELLTITPSVIKLLDAGEKLLPALSKKFTDNTESEVFSRCADRYLTRGELSIIIADRIEGMPYYTLTHFENCIVELCDNNPNDVEYYLNYIRGQTNKKRFQERYDEWLVSPDRKKYRKNK